MLEAAADEPPSGVLLEHHGDGLPRAAVPEPPVLAPAALDEGRRDRPPAQSLADELAADLRLDVGDAPLVPQLPGPDVAAPGRADPVGRRASPTSSPLRQQAPAARLDRRRRLAPPPEPATVAASAPARGDAAHRPPVAQQPEPQGLAARDAPVSYCS